MMTGVLVFIGLLLAALLTTLITNNTKSIEDINRKVSRVIQITNGNTDTVSQRLAQHDRAIESQVAISAYADEEIEKITNQLTKIVEDIHRLDEEVKKVAHDEKDIRTYYMNYREPVRTNFGVEWAKDITVGEDYE